MGLLSGLVNLTSDVVAVAVAPIRVAVAVTDTAVRPVADMARNLADDIEDELNGE